MVDARIYDSDCGETSRHDPIDGWSFTLKPDKTWKYTRDHEGASSVSGDRVWGTYELEDGVLNMSATRARTYCDRGDPGDQTGEDDEWYPCEPDRMGRLGGKTVKIDGVDYTVRFQQSVDSEDVEHAILQRQEREEARNARAAEISKLAETFRHTNRRVVSDVLNRAGGDIGQASILLYALEQAVLSGLDDRGAQMRKVFLDWDTDGDGAIDAKELQCVLQKLDVPCATDILAAIDTNGDGRIDYLEFCAWLFGSKKTASDFEAAVDLRFRVEGVYSIRGVGFVVSGCVEEGVLVVGKQVAFQPTHGSKPCIGVVSGIQKNHANQDRADPGDKVGVVFPHSKGSIRPKEIKEGDVMVYPT